MLLIAGLSSVMAFEFARRAEESNARAAEIERDAGVQVDKYKMEAERARALSERQSRTSASTVEAERSQDALRKANLDLKASLERSTADFNRMLEKQKKDFKRRDTMGLAYVALKPREDQQRLARILEHFRGTGKISWSENQWVTEILGGPDLRALLWGKLAGMDNAAIDDLAARKDTQPEFASELRKMERSKLDPESFFGTE